MYVRFFLFLLHINTLMASLFHIYCFISLFFLLAKALIEETKPIYGSHQLITYVVDWVKINKHVHNLEKNVLYVHIQDIPKSIPWEKLDHIAYAFAVPNQQGELTQFDEAQLRKSKYKELAKGKGKSTHFFLSCARC